jgi:hypothetical protein
VVVDRCTAGFQSCLCPLWVNRVASISHPRSRHVRFAPKATFTNQDVIRRNVRKRMLVSKTQASFSHFSMKLFFAAPESFLPSELTAFGSHASRLHFFKKLLSAAPASGLPFLSTALLVHVSCAIAGPMARAAIIVAKRIRFTDFLPLGGPAVFSKNFSP